MWKFNHKASENERFEARPGQLKPVAQNFQVGEVNQITLKTIETPYLQPKEEVSNKLESDEQNGLSSEEIESRLQKYGPNKLHKEKQKSIWQILLDQMLNPVIYLLVIAVIVSFIFGDIPEAIAIIVVILLNTAIGFWMEFQARQSMKALKALDRRLAHVIRDGEQKEIDAEDLVPGDLLVLSAGELVTADARIATAKQLKSDESALTGESLPVDKKHEILEGEKGVGDRVNMVFKGTVITNGSGTAIVVSTGMDTELGDISKMVSDAESEEVPLTTKLESLSKKLIWATLGLAALFFLVGWLSGKEVYELIQTSIAWTIAAIPEGLPIVASIALARGMLRLSRKNVIVKRLAAVETLGETTVIFTDKTGTLTLNKLHVETIVRTGEKYSPDTKEQDNSTGENDLVEKIMTLCNDASLKGDDGPSGDPLEIASLEYISEKFPEKYKEWQSLERDSDVPFDSDLMMMATAHQEEGRYFIAVKGAIEKVLEVCRNSRENGLEESLTDDGKKELIDLHNKMASDGLRVIAFAFKETDHSPDEEELLENLTYCGLAGYLDPPREEVRESLEECHHAGIKVVMLTGDHPGTAQQIARQVSLSDNEREAVHGANLNELSDEEIRQRYVFARVDPSQKLSIIDSYQKNGEIVGMTGDGVNDAPALKKADIGIAMGKKGTQVAQEVSDMVLKDDAFSSIVSAIREGRIVFGNIQKFIVYQLSYHLAEIIVIAAISFSLFYLPLLPLQLLFLNLLSDVFPALALGIGEGHPKVMEHPPNAKEKPIIPKEKWIQIGMYALVLAMAITGAYFFAYAYWDMDKEVCNNVAFFSLAFAQLLHVFNMRDPEEPIFINQVTQNKYVWMALAFCTAALIAAYLIPGISGILSLQELDTRTWGLIIITSFIPLVVIQSIKQIRS